jgi:hypothetical protein
MKTFKIGSALVVKKLDTVFSTDFMSVESILFTRRKRKEKMEPPYMA